MHGDDEIELIKAVLHGRALPSRNQNFDAYRSAGFQKALRVGRHLASLRQELAATDDVRCSVEGDRLVFRYRFADIERKVFLGAVDWRFVADDPVFARFTEMARALSRTP